MAAAVTADAADVVGVCDVDACVGLCAPLCLALRRV